MDDLIEANDFFLAQATRVLRSLNDQSYRACDDVMAGSSIGQHLRHCLDHYHSFLEGLPGGVIDYDHRERDEEVECLLECAANRLEDLRSRLRQARGRADEPVKVKMNDGGKNGTWQSSSLGRELQFLLSHTVHHFAMIKAMASKQGVEVGDDFGVAPSTLEYRRRAGVR